MAELLDANWFRACVFGAAALAMVVAWRHERVRFDRIESVDRRILWPTCWLLIGMAYVTMALAIHFDIAEKFGGLGRAYARNGEWYESRRPLQATAVAIVGIVWLTLIVVGIWRVPERRRRYLASALLCTSLICFAIIRMVSFHYVDTIVARTSVAGVPVGTVVEHLGNILAVILSTVAARRPIPDSAEHAGVPPTFRGRRNVVLKPVGLRGHSERRSGWRTNRPGPTT